ncbi:MAG: T9SS type A sorting domain-containing protein [Bacteroidetes bacterium]|nr:T9SS type A sorting domain-containing protein [Bacteroidota bacterium]
MKKITLSFFISIVCMLLFSLQAQTLLLNEQFNYPVGDSLIAHGWVVHSTGTTPNTILVKSGNLTYTQYPASAGNSAYIKNTGNDINKTFPGQTSGSVYLAALVKVDSTTTTGDYFMHYLKTATTFPGRIYVKKSTTDATQIYFGVQKGSSGATYSTLSYSIDSTFLLVLKYTFMTGTLTNDSISLFINPVIGNEGSPTVRISSTDLANADLDSAYSIALRQGTTANTTYVNVDEIRVANSWNLAVGYLAIPQVTTVGVASISTNSAICSGNVTSNGGLTMISRGICYSTSLNPDTSATHTTDVANIGAFSNPLSGLSIGTTYHYRAYARNTMGVAYGADSTFTTAASAMLASVTTDSVYLIGTNLASVAAKVINDGGSAITSRGVCWKLTAGATTLDSVKYSTGTTGAYVCNLINLTPNTTYYTRAFAINSVGTAYGSELSFSTKMIIPSYKIGQVRTVNSLGVADSLNVNCKLSGVVHGLNYATSGYSFFIVDSTAGINVYKTSTLSYTPTEGDKLRIIGKTAQVNGLIELLPDSLVLLSSGNALFNPITVNLPNNDTLESKLVKIDNLTYLSGWPTTAGSTKTVYTVKNGTDTVVLRIYSNCNLQGTPAPTVSFSIKGIVSQVCTTSPYTTGYQVLPRNTTDLILNYTTPVIITGSTTNIAQHTATCAGNITSDGGYTITSRGVCYRTTANPTTLDSIRTSTVTTGAYTVNLTNLNLSTTYHYRAYFVSSLGPIYYGADSVFTTTANPVVPAVTTNTPTVIGYTNATLSGTVISDGGDTILSRGFCWKKTTNPTIADSMNTVSGSTGSYTASVTTLTDNTNYYVKAYAINAVGIGYGNEIAFTTKKLPVVYNIAQVRTINATTGVADSINVNCKLLGVVHGINFKQYTVSTGYNFYILDPTAGINVYRNTSLTYTPTEGDSIRVIGKIAQVSGLTEIVPDSIVLISQARPLHNPLTITAMSESNESQFVKMTALTYLSGWPTSAGTTTVNVLALRGIDTITLRLYTNCNLQSKAAPTYPFNLTGIVSQIDATSPYLSGYVLIPRDSNDLVNATGINENNMNAFRIYPNPANGKITITMERPMDAEIKIYSLVGSLLLKQESMQQFINIDLSGFGKGIYFVNMLNKSNGKTITEKLIIQ